MKNIFPLPAEKIAENITESNVAIELQAKGISPVYKKNPNNEILNDKINFNNINIGINNNNFIIDNNNKGYKTYNNNKKFTSWTGYTNLAKQ